MIITYVGMCAGLLLGFAAAGPLGAALGVLVGLAIGMALSGVTEAKARIPAGAVLAREEQRLLCIPKGQVATATFVRDAHTNRWLDVERCSLCEPQDQVACQKRCLLLIRDALPAQKHAAHA
ncbi:MAG: hypothetical protein FJ265_00190 [Planctomycetes bacterium]|nr:hypothetical protein [Planctomycetota bacterium]